MDLESFVPDPTPGYLEDGTVRDRRRSRPFIEEENTHMFAITMQAGEQLLGTVEAEAHVQQLVEFTNRDHIGLVVQAAYSPGEADDDSL